jgi:hypothetical protein
MAVLNFVGGGRDVDIARAFRKARESDKPDLSLVRRGGKL